MLFMVIMIMLQYSFFFRNTPLTYAIEYSSIYIVEELLKDPRVDPNAFETFGQYWI